MTRGLALALALAGCEYGSPRVEFVNRMPADRVVRNAAFRGAIVPRGLALEEVTPARDCLRGSSRAYYETLYTPDGGAPLWLHRQTRATYDAVAGETVRVELSPTNDEADLDAPGPFGH